MQDMMNLHEHGVFLRGEAVERGYTDRQIRAAVRAGVLVRIRQGAYVDAARWRDRDATGRHRLLCHAVLLTHHTPVALSHQSGAAMHGLDVWGVGLDRAHLTRVGVHAARKHHDVAYHEAPRLEPIEIAPGVPVLPAPHCALGAASLGSIESGMVVLDSAYRSGLATEASMRAAYADLLQWPGTAKLQITLRLATAGSGSVGESRARYLFWNQSLPNPVLQYPVYDGDLLVGLVDFAWPDRGVIVEFDGRIKYGHLLKPGESAADAVYREKLREDRIRELTGWRIIRLTWSDLRDPQRTAERIRRAFRAGSR